MRQHVRRHGLHIVRCHKVAAVDGGSSLRSLVQRQRSPGAHPQGASNSGAVYVYTRDAAGAWSQQAYIKASNTDAGDKFVVIALSGDTLAVGAPFEDSAATGINGDQSDNSANGSGAVYVYARDGAGVWSQQAYVKASNTDAGDQFGFAVALSGVSVVHAWFALHPLPSGDHLCGKWRLEVGHWLASHSTNDFSIASTAAGYIPYYAERPAVDLMGLTHPEMARLTFVRGSAEYGAEVARIADEDEVCAFIVPVCGSLPGPNCPLPPQSWALLSGIVTYLDSTSTFQAAAIELESKRNLIIYVRDTCRDRVWGVDYCDASDPAGC